MDDNDDALQRDNVSTDTFITENVLTDVADVYRILKSLQQQRSLLTVELNKSSTPFTSIILHSDFEKQLIVLDALTPEVGNQLILRSRNIMISGLLDGVPALLKGSKLKVKLSKQLDNAHYFSFPKSIEYNQRRQAYRTNIPRSIASEIRISIIDGGETLRGRLMDISTTGLGCEIFDAEEVNLQEGQVISDVQLWIASTLEIECELICRYPAFDSRQQVLRLGLEFHHLSSQQEREVAKTVLLLQQQARKTETK